MALSDLPPSSPGKRTESGAVLTGEEELVFGSGFLGAVLDARDGKSLSRIE